MDSHNVSLAGGLGSTVVGLRTEGQSQGQSKGAAARFAAGKKVEQNGDSSPSASVLVGEKKQAAAVPAGKKLTLREKIKLGGLNLSQAGPPLARKPVSHKGCSVGEAVVSQVRRVASEIAIDTTLTANTVAGQPLPFYRIAPLSQEGVEKDDVATQHSVSVLAHAFPKEHLFGHFWNQVVSEGTQTVICLTESFASYLPTESYRAGDYSISLLSKEQEDKRPRPGRQPDFYPESNAVAGREEWYSRPASRYVVGISSPEGESKVDVLLVPNMEDGKGADVPFLKSIVEEIRKGRTQVHCHAGLGRTGTVIVAAQLADLHDKQKLNRENFLPALQRLIAVGRAQRGNGEFVQTDEQLYSLLKFGADLLGLCDADLERL